MFAKKSSDMLRSTASGTATYPRCKRWRTASLSVTLTGVRAHKRKAGLGMYISVQDKESIDHATETSTHKCHTSADKKKLNELVMFVKIWYFVCLLFGKRTDFVQDCCSRTCLLYTRTSSHTLRLQRALCGPVVLKHDVQCTGDGAVHREERQAAGSRERAGRGH